MYSFVTLNRLNRTIRNKLWSLKATIIIVMVMQKLKKNQVAVYFFDNPGYRFSPTSRGAPSDVTCIHKIKKNFVLRWSHNSRSDLVMYIRVI